MARPGDPVRTLDPAALVALEFPAVLELVASRAAGSVAAERLQRLSPDTDRSRVVATLADIGELMAAIHDGLAPDIPTVPDVRPSLARLRQDGSVLDATQLGEMRQVIHPGHALINDFDRLEGRAPSLARHRAVAISSGPLRRLDHSINDDGELLDGASPALASARREVHRSRDRLIRKLESILRNLESPGSVTVRAGRYVIPVRRDDRRRPDGIVHDESSSSGTLFIEPTGTIGLGNELRAAVTAAEREELAVLRELTAELREERGGIEGLFEMLVELDSLLARARWAVECESAVPVVGTAGGRLIVRKGRHPLLLARGISVVPFDLVLGGDRSTLLITGPNAGGKTVLLKTTALLVVLAQSGIVPPIGPESELPMLSQLFVDIGDHQSIAADLSTFSAHVTTLRRIIEEADATTMVVLDEVGGGTDPSEGGALAMAVLEELTGRGVLTLATTHLGALKQLATRVPGVVNGSLHFDEATLSPSYRFTLGTPGRSYGLAIARRLGVDETVVATAEALVPAAERNLDRLLAEAEARQAALERGLDDLATRRVELDVQQQRLARREADQAGREQALAERERTAQRDLARQAKAYLLEARKRVEAALELAQGAADSDAARRARKLVEAGIEQQSAELGEVVPVALHDPGKLRVGTRVVLDTGASGELMELRSDGRAVVQVGSMRLVVAANTLAMALNQEPARAVRSTLDFAEPEPIGEVDLRGLRADEAELEVAAALDGAVMSGQSSLSIIHGMGTGVVRDIVQRVVAADRRVAEFRFAPRNQGGTGVTVVTFR